MKRNRVILITAAVVAVGVMLGLYRRETTAEKPSVSASESSVAERSFSVRASAGASAANQTVPFVLPTNQTATVRGTKPYVLRSEQKFQKSLRVAVEALGARTVGVLSAHELLIEADAATCRRLSADRRFAEVSEFRTMSKLEPALAALLKAGAKSVDASIVSLDAADRARVVACVRAGGGEILTGCLNEGSMIRARLSPDLVSTLVGRGDVRWLETFVRPQLTNDRAVEPLAMNVKDIWKSELRADGLSGAGQNISTSDSGIDTGDLATMHADLTNAVADIKVADGCVQKDLCGHGTHTAGSIVGDGTLSDGKIRGTAWGGSLFVWFCGKDGTEEERRKIYTPKTCAELFRGVAEDSEDEEWPAYIHSGSWGSNTKGAYNAECIKFDEYLWAHPDFLPVFSAGNEGQSGAQTIGSPAASKNVLTVGATLNLTKGNPAQTASFSSRGPCVDGRIKPDIAAPGDYVMSTRSSLTSGSGDYTSMSGTSMSCPLTAGAVALVREWLCRRDEYDEENPPTAAMMKAVITGGAKGASVPNMNQGWGRVDLAETLYPSDRAVRLIDHIPFAEDEEFYYVVETTNAAPLDVQLAWVDYPGTVGVKKTLVNDLDLTVESLDGGSETLFGNGGDAADTVNNMESVRMTEAAPGKYLITVTCRTVLHDWEEGGAAALYVRGAFDPEAEPQGLERVRISREPDVTYTALDKALANVQDGDAVEILDAVSLRKSMTLTNSCTIFATNAVAVTSLVSRVKGASLTVTNATLTLSNVVFSASERPLLTIEADGNVTIGAKVDLGIDSEHVAVSTVDRGGFTLAGPLDRGLMLDCAAARAIGEVFGSVRLGPGFDSADANASAAFIVSADDPNGELRGKVEGSELKWDVVPVPLGDAAGYFVDRDDKTNTTARIDRLFEKYEAAMAEGRIAGASEIVLLKSGSLSRSLKVGTDLTIRGETALVLDCGSAGGFTVTNGTLTVRNLTFDGFRGECLFMVDGADAALRLEDSVVSDVLGQAEYSSAVTVLAGQATLKRSELRGCSALGDFGGLGGGAYVKSGASLTLEDSVITNCYAVIAGGGIYLESGATNRISGATVVKDNSAEQFDVANDIYRESGTAVVLVTDRLSERRSIGIMSGDDDGAEPGYAVAVNALDPSRSSGVTNACAQAFFSDGREDLWAVAADDTFIWADQRPPIGSDTDGEGMVVVVSNRVSGTVLYYEHACDAFDEISDDSDVLLRPTPTSCPPIVFDRDITVSHSVAVMTDPSVLMWRGAPCHLDRAADCSINVADGASLTLTNVVISGCVLSDALVPVVATNSAALIRVIGGALTLADGAEVCYAFGDGSRFADAVNVLDGATFTMRDGARIYACANAYCSDPAELCGSGLMLDRSVAYLTGGVISNCISTAGGGVFAGGCSEVYVSGDVRIGGNFESDRFVPKSPISRRDLIVSDDSRLVLDGVLTGVIGTLEGDGANTNVFGSVGVEVTQAIAESATNFWNNLTFARGVVVTNGTEALLVWATSLKTDQGGTRYYEDAAGNRYAMMTSEVPAPIEPQPVPPGPTPEPEYVEPGPIAFKSITKVSETEWALVVTDRVQWAEYRLIWTEDLTQGFTTTGAWEQATADGAWTTNVVLEAPAPAAVFWKAEAQKGQKQTP